MRTQNAQNLRSTPTSRTLAILSCALALLTVNPTGPARAACNPNEAAVRPASTPTIQSPTWQLTGKPTLLSTFPSAQSQNAPPRNQARQAPAEATQWETKLLFMQAYLLTALASPPLPPTDYLTEVPAVVQIAVPTVLRTHSSSLDCISPPPPPIERWFALTHYLLAPPHHA